MVGDRHEVCPFGCFADGHPSFQGRDFHDLRPQSGIVCDRGVGFGEDAAEIETVADSAELCDAQGDVLGVGKKASFAGGVLGKFRAGVGAGGTYH